MRVSDCIPDDVLERAPKHVLITENMTALKLAQHDPALLSLSFEVGIHHNMLEQLI